ncbi:MAG TPA: hypothetical protein VMN60_10435 [Longimicrobiales bacterium]|nr:hypothetical protein [Longimicrobiales bacterium]
MRRISTLVLPTLLALVPAACDRAGAPVTFTIAADSMIRLVHDTAADGAVNVGCSFSLLGTVEGPAGEAAIVRGGRVAYMWWENSLPGPVYEWTADAAARLWQDSLFATGEVRMSAAHGLGQSEPARLVRGTVTFDYAATNNDSTLTTNAWNFYCH